MLETMMILALALPQPRSAAAPPATCSPGGYCAPTSEKSPAAVPKVGQCPSNWAQSGAYCVDQRRR